MTRSDPLTHPPNHTPTHGWGSLHRLKIFKQNWIILIHSSLIEYLLIWGVPPMGVGGWDWVGLGWVGTTPNTCKCTHMHVHTCMHTCVWHHREFPGIPQWGSHLHEIIMFIMYACACVCMCACTCTYTWGLPPSTHTPIHPRIHPPPRKGNLQNSEISISLELIKIIQFCLKFLYLWTLLNSSRLMLITPDTPHPPDLPPGAKEAQIVKTW